MNDLTKSNENNALAAITLLNKKVKIELSRAELDSLSMLVKGWIVVQNMQLNELFNLAVIQACMQLSEKLRAKSLLPKKKMRISLSLMHAYALQELLNELPFASSASYEANLADRITTQINQQL